MMRLQKLLCVASFMLAGATIPAIAQNIIELPDSLWQAGDTVQWVSKVTGYCEGPAWEPATGSVYFTEQAQSGNAAHWPIRKVKPGTGDTGSIWYNNLQSNGLYFDAQNRLVTAQNGRLTRFQAVTPGAEAPVVDTVLVTSGTNGVTFNQANDLSIGKNGAIYFTDLQNRVFYLSPSRQLSTAVANMTPSANGIYWLEEEKAVYVHSAATNGNIFRFDIDSTTGALINRTTFIAGVNTPDGGTLDVNGNRYVASYSLGEIRVYNKAGTYLGRIAIRMPNGTIYDAVSFRQGNQGNASNAIFGGPDMKTLYITGDGGLYSIRLKIPGRQPQGPVSLKGLVDKHRQGRLGVKAPLRESRDVRGRVVTKGGGGVMLKQTPEPRVTE
jgi:sugar lactone lactonase YvrE